MKKNKLSYDEKHLLKLETKLRNYMNTCTGMEYEYRKYDCADGKKAFSSEEHYKRYLDSLRNDIDKMKSKIDDIQKDISRQKEKINETLNKK